MFPRLESRKRGRERKKWEFVGRTWSRLLKARGWRLRVGEEGAGVECVWEGLSKLSFAVAEERR